MFLTPRTIPDDMNLVCIIVSSAQNYLSFLLFMKFFSSYCCWQLVPWSHHAFSFPVILEAAMLMPSIHLKEKWECSNLTCYITLCLIIFHWWPAKCVFSNTWCTLCVCVCVFCIYIFIKYIIILNKLYWI